MQKGDKRPYYGKRTKKQVIEEYFNSSASMEELSEIHGILGSNTVGNWLRKYGNLRSTKRSNSEIMNKPHSSKGEKNYRKKRYKTESFILKKVHHIRKDMPKLGGKKLYFLINKEPERRNYKFGEKRFFDVLRAHDLLVKRKKRHVFTTDSSHWRRQYADLVRYIIPSCPEQLWVSDITYFRTKAGFIYGHLITDGYSKKLVGFEVSDNMKATTTLLALKMAIKNRYYAEELIHLSDRGFQYLSRIYTDYLKKHKIRISVTQDGNPYHNAVAERINGILKEEFGFYGVFDSLEQAKELIEKSARIYNDKRPHWSNHLLTPNEMHQQRELKIKTWRKNNNFGIIPKLESCVGGIDFFLFQKALMKVDGLFEKERNAGGNFSH